MAFKKGHKSYDKKGKNNPKWRGGILKHEKGYIYRYSPTHPYKTKMGYIFEHRIVMESHIGRILLPQEVVHHINGIKDDNRIENLMLFVDESQHQKSEHRRKRNKLGRWVAYG